MHGMMFFFSRLCLTGIGRYIHADECTVDKARLDFVRILILTPNIEIKNMSSEFLIDGSKYVIKLVEEWGCNLGEDAFMMEIEADSRPEALSQPNNVVGMDEVQGEWELDDLCKILEFSLNIYIHILFYLC